jgi:hypothetical protein
MFNYNKAREALKRGVAFDDIVDMDIRDKIARMRYLEESGMDKIDGIKEELTAEFDRMIKGNGGQKDIETRGQGDTESKEAENKGKETER